MNATRKSIGITLMLLVGLLSRTFGQSNANAIVGIWESDKKDVRMEIYKEADKYYGKYLWEIRS